MENLSQELDQPLSRSHHLNQRDTKAKTVTSHVEKVKKPTLPHGGRALAPSHFPQFPLHTQNLQKSQYSRPFCHPKPTIPTPIPTAFSRRPRASLSTFFTFFTKHKKSEKTCKLTFSAPNDLSF
jgi:hypothetical protein